MVITDYVYPAIIGIIGALVTNIIYFEYRFYKEKQVDFLKMQIDELLLPLFIKMNLFEIESFNLTFGSELKIAKDEDILKIAKEKLNLANPKLSRLLLQFINNQHIKYEPDSSNYYIVEKNIEELKQVVFTEYYQKVEEYQYMNPWWKFW